MSRRISTRNARRIRRGISLGRETAKLYRHAVESANDEHEDPTVAVILLKVASRAHLVNLREVNESGAAMRRAYLSHACRWMGATERRNWR